MQKPPRLTLDAALFLDFDGTLVPLAPSPEAIQIPPKLASLLCDLHRLLGGALAVVSGRPIEVIDRYLAPLRLPVAGEHGMQRRDAQGHLTVQPLPDLEAAIEAATALAQRHPALLVERKTSSVALHFRQAPELEAKCRDTMAEAIADDLRLDLLRGKFVVEVKAADVGKDSAIAAFLRERPFAGRLPVFAGDDVTDEAGFAVLEAIGGITVKVGAGSSMARHHLDSPAAVLAWLTQARDAFIVARDTSDTSDADNAGQPAP